MPALHNQPFPAFRASRAAWIRGEIRALHAKFLADVPALPEGDDARQQVVWERLSIAAGELRAMCAELAGLET